VIYTYNINTSLESKYGNDVDVNYFETFFVLFIVQM
jgi:hypothetical protein